MTGSHYMAPEESMVKECTVNTKTESVSKAGIFILQVIYCTGRKGGQRLIKDSLSHRVIWPIGILCSAIYTVSG